MNGEIEKIHDWGNGFRFTVAGLAEMSETMTSKKIVLNKDQIRRLIPHRGEWMFLDNNVEIIGNKAIAKLGLLDYFIKVNRLFNKESEKIKIISRGESFLVIEKTVTENDCQGHFTPKGLQIPGHLVMDYFQLGAERLLNLQGLYLCQTWGKFCKPIQPGKTAVFHLKRDKECVIGRAFVGKELSSVWKGCFALRIERKQLYFSPLHTLFEAMSQMAACLVYRKYNLNETNPLKVALRQSRAKVNPLPLKENISLIVEMAKVYKREGKLMVEFQGEIEEKIFWRGKSLLSLI